MFFITWWIDRGTFDILDNKSSKLINSMKQNDLAKPVNSEAPSRTFAMILNRIFTYIWKNELI